LDERRLATAGQRVDRARHQLLTAAVLAVDQHAADGGGGGGDGLAQGAHRLAVADDLGPHVEARLESGVLPLEPAVLERAGRAHAVALVLEHGAEGGLDGRFVVDDQDVLARHLQASTGAGARVTGTSMTKRVPEGWLSSTRMVPPCSLTISLTIGSPRPMPVTLVEK